MTDWISFILHIFINHTNKQANKFVFGKKKRDLTIVIIVFVIIINIYSKNFEQNFLVFICLFFCCKFLIKFWLFWLFWLWWWWWPNSIILGNKNNEEKHVFLLIFNQKIFWSMMVDWFEHWLDHTDHFILLRMAKKRQSKIIIIESPWWIWFSIPNSHFCFWFCIIVKTQFLYIPIKNQQNIFFD